MNCGDCCPNSENKMKNDTKKINQVVFFNLLGPIILNGINFFTIPIFTRILGTENYGVYTIYASYLSILVILMGLQTQSIIAPTSIYYDGENRDKCFSNALTISLVSSLLFSLIIGILIIPISQIVELSVSMIVVMMLHSAGMVATQWALFKFTYDKQAKTNFVFSIVIALSGVGLSFLFIKGVLKHQESYFGYALGHAIPYIIAGTGFFIYFLYKGKSFFSKKEWAFCLPLCLPIVFHGLSNTVLHQCDKVMIQKIVNDSETGIYGFAVAFANVMNIIFNALNTTWVPFYHDDIKTNQKERLKQKTKNYVFLYSCLSIGFIMAMPEVVKLFAQSDFWPSIKIIPILIVGTYFVFLYTFPVNFEFYHKKTKMIAIGTALACVANIVLNYFLIHAVGMFGAALATMISYILLYLFHSFIAKVIIKQEYHYPYKFFYLYLAIFIIFVAVFYLIVDMVIIRWSIFFVAAILTVWKVYKNKSIF